MYLEPQIRQWTRLVTCHSLKRRHLSSVVSRLQPQYARGGWFCPIVFIWLLSHMGPRFRRGRKALQGANRKSNPISVANLINSGLRFGAMQALIQLNAVVTQ